MPATETKAAATDLLADRASVLLDQVKADPELWEVCGKYDLGAPLRVAADLAMQTFSPVDACHVELDVDPDTALPRLVLDITVNTSNDVAFRQYAAYTRQWVAALPPEAREQIRLIFHTPQNQ
jgi:hypothetical protein